MELKCEKRSPQTQTLRNRTTMNSTKSRSRSRSPPVKIPALAKLKKKLKTGAIPNMYRLVMLTYIYRRVKAKSHKFQTPKHLSENNKNYRDRSRPVKILPLTKLKTKPKEEPIPDVYRLIFGAYRFDQDELYLESFYLNIPSKTLESFRTKRVYDKVSLKLPFMPVSIARTNCYVYSKPILVGSSLYAMATTEVPGFFQHKLDLDLIILDLNSNLSEWNKFHSPPPFEIYTTLKSVLIYLHGCIYVLGAYPAFGACFSFKTRKWSQLKGPNGVNINSKDIRFIASLGDSVGKFLVHGFEDGVGIFTLVYNVGPRKWEKYPDKPLENAMNRDKILGMPMVVDENHCSTIYFIKQSDIDCIFECETNDIEEYARIYGFECGTNKLFEGHVQGLSRFGDGFRDNAFLHFGRDLLCLCSFYSFYDLDSKIKSTLTFTFMKVIKDRVHSTLDAYIVGYLEHSFEGNYIFHYASFLPNTLGS